MDEPQQVAPKRKGPSFTTGVVVGVVGTFIGGAVFYIVRSYREKRLAEVKPAEAPPEPQPGRSSTADYYLNRQNRTFTE